MAKSRLSNKKLLLYDKYARNLAVFVVSFIIFGIFLLQLLIINLQNSCSGLIGSSHNACLDGGVVVTAFCLPVMFLSFIIALVSGIKMFSSKIELGKDFNKAKKTAQRNNVKVKKEKEYTDDSV